MRNPFFAVVLARPLLVASRWSRMLLLLFACAPLALLSQSKVKVYYEKTEEMQNCRVQLEDLKPVLAYDNPFIRNHRWDEVKIIERAELGPGRELTIEQFGCLRYHQKLTLDVKRSELKGEPNPSLFLHETLEMLRVVHWDNEEYRHYRKALEQKLIEQLATLACKKRINFPLHEFNVFLEIDANPSVLSVQLEFIRFVHDEKIALPGIKPHLDDGHRESSVLR